MLRDVFLSTYESIKPKVTRAHIEQTVRTYLSSYAVNDIEGRRALFADDVIAEEPIGAVRIEGLDALTKFWRGSLDAGWQCANHLTRLVVNGDEAMVHFRSDLSLSGEGGVTLEVFETLVFNDKGRIKHLRAYNDATCLS
jgi:ketosteroid isomerase-like protein